MHDKPDDEAPDADLCAHVKELCDDAAHKMIVSQDPAPTCRSSPFFGGGCLADFRQVREVDYRGDSKKNAADHQVRNANRGRLRRAIRLQGSRTEPRELLR